MMTNFRRNVNKLVLQPVDMADVAGFFVDHAISDNLGIIANAHLAMADQAAEVRSISAPAAVRSVDAALWL